MSGAPVEPKALLEGFQISLRTELANWARPEPPPGDPDAEQSVLRAVLSGRISTDDLPALQGRHFLFAQHAVLFELLRDTTDPQALYVGMRERGYGAGSSVMIAELTELPGEPHLSREHLAMAASRLIELWRVRRLSSELRRVASLIEVGAVGPTESAESLRDVYREIRA